MRSLKERQSSKLLAVACMFCFTAAALGDSVFLPSTMKVATLLAVCMAFVILLVHGDFNNIRLIGGFVVVYAIWIFVIMVYSMIIWILNFESVRFIMRGCSKVSYQLILIAVMAAAAYMFGEKAIHYTFYGLALGNAVIALLYIPSFGISGVVSSFIDFVLTMGDATGYMRRLEIHDITFTYGFFLIYFLLFDKISSKRVKVFNIIVAAVFFYIGFKRIAIASFFLVLAVGFFLGKLTPKAQLKIMRLIAVCGILFACVYLIFIKYGLFVQIMNDLGVDIKGRDVLYGYIDKYYRISPAFWGFGFEYVHIMMLEIAEAGGRQFNGMIDIHNDFMRVYIEMGFWGFLAWLYYTLIFQFNWIKSKFSSDTLRLFLLCEIYIFMTYMTDNTLFYFFTGMVLRMMPLCHALHIDRDKREYGGKLVLLNDQEQRRFEILSERGQESVTLYKKKTKDRNR